jgi:type I restriction-modification system DNA methylase subunit
MASNNDIEKRLWSAADELRANSKMRASDYSAPVLGLIFLRYADAKFSQAEMEVQNPVEGFFEITSSQKTWLRPKKQKALGGCRTSTRGKKLTEH